MTAPNAPASEQEQIATLWDEQRTDVRVIRSEMHDQIDLLQERKRSLITAAVTGEFDVTAASGRGVA